MDYEGFRMTTATCIEYSAVTISYLPQSENTSTAAFKGTFVYRRHLPVYQL